MAAPITDTVAEAPKTNAAAPAAATPAADAENDADDAGERFLDALVRISGITDTSEESIRAAIANLTMEQRQQLQEEATKAKAQLLEKPEKKEERELFRSTVNKEADKSGIPVDKDGAFLASKVSAFMETSSEQMPTLTLLEALAASPYLVKDALAELNLPPADRVPPADIDAVEAELADLKAEGWRHEQRPDRPPVVRRSLVLLSYHMHRERLGGLSLSPATAAAAAQATAKAARLLDVLFGLALHRGWVKTVLAVTELQGLLTCGLWDAADGECRQLLRQRLVGYGLKPPRLQLQCPDPDVRAGAPVRLAVTVTRTHAHTAAEMERDAQRCADKEATAEAEAKAEAKAETKAEAEAEAAAEAEAKAEGTAEAAAEAKDGSGAQADREAWWLIVESIKSRGSSKLPKDAPIVHNTILAHQVLSAALDEPQMSAEFTFDAPTTPGEYQILLHLRSSALVGCDAKSRVLLTVKAAPNAKPKPEP